MLPNHRMAAARDACDCDPSYGIAFACPITTLNKMTTKKIMRLVQGETCDLPKLPAFSCPRHEIMGW